MNCKLKPCAPASPLISVSSGQHRGTGTVRYLWLLRLWVHEGIKWRWRYAQVSWEEGPMAEKDGWAGVLGWVALQRPGATHLWMQLASADPIGVSPSCP